jgi:hypothetical protein
MGQARGMFGVTVTVAGQVWAIPEPDFEAVQAKDADVCELVDPLREPANSQDFLAGSLAVAYRILRDAPGFVDAYPDIDSFARSGVLPRELKHTLLAWCDVCRGDTEPIRTGTNGLQEV